MAAAKGLRLIVSDGSQGLKAALELVDLGRGVRHQLCVFHRLRNIGKAVKGLLVEAESTAESETGEAAKETKAAREARRKRAQEVVKEAARIYQGADRAEVLGRRDGFVAKWQESEPEAVATLLRDFEQTIVYLDVRVEAASRGEAWEVRYLRTTSALERLNRTVRQMLRQVILLHSERGLEVRVYLTLLQAGQILIPGEQDWSEVMEKELAIA